MGSVGAVDFFRRRVGWFWVGKVGEMGFSFGS